LTICHFFCSTVEAAARQRTGRLAAQPVGWPQNRWEARKPAGSPENLLAGGITRWMATKPAGKPQNPLDGQKSRWLAVKPDGWLQKLVGSRKNYETVVNTATALK
jgi:hypothetical protein